MIIYQTMHGLGDCVYTFPVIEHILKTQHNIGLSTPFPELYLCSGMCSKIQFYDCPTNLRTQKKNIKKYKYPEIPHNANTRKIQYTSFVREGKTIPESLQLSAGVSFDYKLNFAHIEKEQKNYVIIRPATIRTEWSNPARNCKQEYIQFCIDYLNSKNIKTILIADIKEGEEDFAEFKLKNATIEYIRGEISTTGLIRLYANAKFSITPVGFALPLGIAVRTKTLVLYGGQGFFNNPEILSKKLGEYTYNILNKEFCRCKDANHNCSKELDLQEIRNNLDMLINGE